MNEELQNAIKPIQEELDEKTVGYDLTDGSWNDDATFEISLTVKEINAFRAAIAVQPKDWRIGLTVKPKYRNHERYYERGTVRWVEGDRLRIEMLHDHSVIIEPADYWVTA